MDLREACLAALPASQWRDAAHAGVAVALLSRIRWSANVDAVRALLDPAEIARVDRKRLPSDHDTTLLAYAFHRQLLAIVLDCAPLDVPLYRDALGCPRLAGLECWTSLSHADPFVAVAISARGAVGIDVERASRASEMAGIGELVAHQEERERLYTLPEEELARALLALWVRKEALLKAAGIGLAEPMTGFSAPVGTPLQLPGRVESSAEVRMLAFQHVSGDVPVGAVAIPVGCITAEHWIG